MPSQNKLNEFEGIDYAKVNEDVARSISQTGWKYYLALSISGALVIYGAVVYYYRTILGVGIAGTMELDWGLDIANYIFWIGFSLSGTLLSAILLLTKSDWRNPIYRVAELMTSFALIVAIIAIVTHVGRPWRLWYDMPYPNFRALWPNFRTPLLWDAFGLPYYLTASLLFLIVGSIPDFAALRDHMTGWRKKVYTVLSFGWKGTATQWRHFRRAYLLIAIFIIPVAVGMHSVTAWFQSMTLNPAVHSTIYPVYFVTGALLSGVAGVIIILILVRRLMNFQEYIRLRHIDNLAKLVLVASMLITYIYAIELFVPWYKHANFELMTVAAKVRGSYASIFWSMIIFNSIIPLSLFSRKIRRNTVVLFIIACGVQIGMYFERFLIVIPGQANGVLPSTWGIYSPNWVELSLTLWCVSIFAFLFLLSIKLIPVVSIFEVKEILKVPMRNDDVDLHADEDSHVINDTQASEEVASLVNAIKSSENDKGVDMLSSEVNTPIEEDITLNDVSVTNDEAEIPSAEVKDNEA